MTYSLDFRRKVLDIRDKDNLTIAEVSARFCVGIASVVRWIKDIEPKAHGFRKRKLDIEALKQDILEFPDAYQYERAKRLGVVQNSIFHALKKLNITYKKNSQSPQTRRRRTADISGKD